MSKIRSIQELEDEISKEYSWRFKEIVNLKQTSLGAKGKIQESLFRSSITMLYAHWEGFVKNSSVAYFKYINFKGYKYHELKPHYKVLALFEIFNGQYPKTYTNYRSIFDETIDIDDMKCKVTLDKFIDTQSNLKSEVLRDIVSKLGMDYKPFELKEKFIDEVFLAARNAIAHGEYRVIESTDFIRIFDEVTTLIQLFRNELSNLIALNMHLK